MADSDEEYDRKKRDKFRRERSDYSTERRRSDHDRRSTWREEYNEARKRSRDDEDERDGRGGGRYHYGGSSPGGRRGGDWSPPSKRYRRDGWESLRDYGGHGMMPGAFMMDRRPPPWMMGGELPHGAGMSMPPGARGMPGEMMMGFSSMGDSRQRGSTLLTFKQFLTQQDDSIDDVEAIRLYHEYKADFKKKQLHQFFNDHKEEDWLLAKYHPKRVAENHREYLSNIQKRGGVFEWLHERSKLEQVPFVMGRTEDIVRMMDTSVILMEGGDENDLRALDLPLEVSSSSSEPSTGTTATSERRSSSTNSNGSKEKKTKDVEPKDNISEGSKRSPSFDVSELTPEQQQLANKAKQYVQANDHEEESVSERKRPREEDSSNDEETAATKKTHTSTPDPEPSGTEEAESNTSPPLPPTDEPMADQDQSEARPPPTPPPPPPLDTLQEEPQTTEAQPETGQTESKESNSDEGDDVENISTKDGEEADNTSAAATTAPPPRHLHITKAVYIRHIPPVLSAADILEVCQTIPGYLRLAFAEPQPDKGYERRGWATYSASTDILEVTARISAAKIKNIQLNCQVNKDLSRRVKPVPPVTWARGVVIHDVRQLLKLIEVFDKKGQLWQYQEKEKKKEEDDKAGDEGEGKSGSSKEKKSGEEESEEADMETAADDVHEEEPVKANPLLDVPESLFSVESSGTKMAGSKVKTAAATTTSDDDEDEEGGIGDDDDEEGVISDPNTEVLPLDSPLMKVLDQLLWYVRLVHSLDYYNFTHFPDEDRMPHRFGIVSVRPKPPNSITSEEVAEHIKNVDEKVTPLLAEKKELNEEEMDKLGKRDQDTELEKFIDANTQKLGENKYLCPLSGKKFRGPDFVRKHIFNKHKGALEEVKSDTEYFNNYLRDPDRPVPLDGSTVIASGVDEGKREGMGMSQRGWGSPDMMAPGFHGSRFDHRGSRGQRRFQKPRGSGFGGNRGSIGRRKLHHYEDLDAPVDMY